MTRKASYTNEDMAWVDQYLHEPAAKHAAGEKLVKKYHKSLLKFVNSRISGIDAEDLVQEIYAKAFKNLASYNPHYAFSTWLFNIADHVCIDHFRLSERNRKRAQRQEIHPGQASDWTCTENNDDEAFSPLSPVVLLEKVPEKYKEVFTLRYIEQAKYKDIAQKLSLPMGTVKTYLYRAKAALNAQHTPHGATKPYRHA